MNIRFLPCLALLLATGAQAQTQMHSPKTSFFEGHTSDQSETLLATGRLALLMDQPVVAVENLVEAVEVNPENTDALVLLGDIARTESRLELAAEYYELATRIDPSLVNATLWTSRYRSLTGESAQAIEMLDRALIDNPTNPDLLVAQGHLLLEQGDSFRALDYLLNAVEVAPSLFEGQRLLGLALLNTRQWGAAESAYRQALAIRDDLDVHIELAQVYDASSAAPKRALDHLLYVLERQPEHVTALSMAGDILLQLDNTTAAQNVWRRAIR
ncbi:MAG: tetratricopeptide repeat protein, partial [Myxococcota bacterium]|nr:tetratricopeptide repeat protein [Myxococcota bacterium]